MENKNTPNQELENLLRKGLEQVKQSPDAEVWGNIAARQHPKNFGLRIRHIAKLALPLAAVALLVLAGWWYFGPENQVESDALPTPAYRQTHPAAGKAPAEPVAGVLPDAAGEQPEAGIPTATQSRPSTGPGLNTVPAATVNFRAETGVQYQSPTTGTSVRIPANALVDASGRPVQGEVELTLREYRDIPDFLASGIPMHYADERGAFFFNSGGMFEVRVSQNGEPLNMAPGQAYDLTFAATNELTNANMFYLNDDTGEWEYLPDPAFGGNSKLYVIGVPGSRDDGERMFKPDAREATTPSQARIVTESQAVQNNRANQTCLPRIPEAPSSFDAAKWVKTGVKMGHELASGKTKLPTWFRKRPWIKLESLLNSVERGQIRIVRTRDVSELFFPEDVSGTFTELRAFKDCYFFRDDNQSEPDKKLRTDIHFDRVSVVQETGNRCLISMYSDKHGLYQVYADLTASSSNKSFDAAAVMSEYQRLRTERLNNLETMLENLRMFLFVAPAFQSEDEWCMPYPEWLDHFDTNRATMAKRYAELVKKGLDTNDALAVATWNNWLARVRGLHLEDNKRTASTDFGSKQSLQYALRLTNFGTYNCDQIFRLGGERRDPVYASYQTSDGKRVYASTVSVLERNTRLFFTLPEADKLLNLPGRGLDVVVTDRNGRQYHLPAEDYSRAQLDGRQVYTFTVKDVTDITRTPKDWAEYLEM